MQENYLLKQAKGLCRPILDLLFQCQHYQRPGRPLNFRPYPREVDVFCRKYLVLYYMYLFVTVFVAFNAFKALTTALPIRSACMSPKPSFANSRLMTPMTMMSCASILLTRPAIRQCHTTRPATPMYPLKERRRILVEKHSR